ncbi:MAG TPA: hypothetical protein VKH81_17655 [Candidatus Angelobacter sp.]|nr:hypothetical protein [Candidatus Angelobacter sp.]
MLENERPFLFDVDEQVPASGMYSVFHDEHCLQSEVMLFKGEYFPRCSRCREKVVFSMSRPIPALDRIRDLSVRMPLHELPVLITS